MKSIIDNADMREMAILTSQLHILRGQIAVLQSMILVVGAVRASIHPEAVAELLDNLRTEAESLASVDPILEEQIELLRRTKAAEIRTTLTG